MSNLYELGYELIPHSPYPPYQSVFFFVRKAQKNARHGIEDNFKLKRNNTI